MTSHINTFERKLHHLLKLGRLQGFVSELELDALAESAEERESLANALIKQGVTLNPFLSRKRRVKAEKTSSEKCITPQKADSLWAYFKHMGDIPLLEKEQLIQFSRQMVFARNKLLDIAFAASIIHTYLFELVQKLELGSLSCSAVFENNGEKINDINMSCDSSGEQKRCASDQESKIAFFKDSIAVLLEENRVEGFEQNDALRDTIVERCFMFGLNERQKTVVLEKYHRWLILHSPDEALETFDHWEKVYIDAKSAIIEANIRLVITLAKKYQFKGMEIADLIQEGNRGLIKAVEHFDYRKGYSFSTYATWWIRKAIMRGLSDMVKSVRIPDHTLEMLNSVTRYSQRYILEHGTKPDESDIAAALNISEKKVKTILAFPNLDPISLEQKVNNTHDDTDRTLKDFIVDRTIENPVDLMVLKQLRENIHEVLGELNEKERNILIMRFGLDDGCKKSLAEISDVMEISRERVRQIEQKGLQKLQHPSKRNLLSEWRDCGDEFCEG